MVIIMHEEQTNTDPSDTQQNPLYETLIKLIPTRHFPRPAAMNAMKHGMNNDYILPCKKEKCFFHEVCEMMRQGMLQDVPYGSPCAMEIATYMDLAEGYALKDYKELDNIQVAMVRSVIMHHIKLNRHAMMTAVEGGVLTRDVPSWNYGGLALSYRYGVGLHKRLLRYVKYLHAADV
jgi:hypothetical protein